VSLNLSRRWQTKRAKFSLRFATLRANGTLGIGAPIMRSAPRYGNIMAALRERRDKLLLPRLTRRQYLDAPAVFLVQVAM
jgi:hypothetical protein